MHSFKSVNYTDLHLDDNIHFKQIRFYLFEISFIFICLQLYTYFFKKYYFSMHLCIDICSGLLYPTVCLAVVFPLKLLTAFALNVKIRVYLKVIKYLVPLILYDAFAFNYNDQMYVIS